MTTEHVSVPREIISELESIQTAVIDAIKGDYDISLAMLCTRLTAILSRATPSDVLPEHIGHPRSPGETRDEIEMFLRDAYAAGCNAALRNSLVVAMEYARREAPRLRAILKPSAPRVVTDEDVERACKARFPETWGMMAENLKVIYRATSRRMLESFATSLPAARVSDEIRQEARRLLEYYTDSSLAPYVEDLPHSGVEKFLERLAK